MADFTYQGGWHVALEPLADLGALEHAWLKLQGEAEHSFFQSWGWVGCWLSVLPAEIKPLILRISRGDEVVGLALLTPRTGVRHYVFVSRGQYLSESGDPSLDVLTIEYNGMLAKLGFERPVVDHALKFLREVVSGWDELFISGLADSAEQMYAACAAANGLYALVLGIKPYFYVNLGELRDSRQDYLEAISSNTRYQIRRALRGYEKSGDLAVNVARTMDEAFAYLAELKQRHQSYWMAKGHAGAFSQGLFETFHRRLIETRFRFGEIQLIEIVAGDSPIGYLYNFIKGNHVYSYQSGFQYDTDSKLKPGLASHYLAIEHNIRAGADIYDFMAGDSQYKRSLATHDGDMAWLALQRKTVKFLLERSLKTCYRRLCVVSKKATGSKED
jgi:CelD/BcsL family acetyltransferase involved in cellulose biosynthesis